MVHKNLGASVCVFGAGDNWTSPHMSSYHKPHHSVISFNPLSNRPSESEKNKLRKEGEG